MVQIEGYNSNSSNVNYSILFVSESDAAADESHARPHDNTYPTEHLQLLTHPLLCNRILSLASGSITIHLDNNDTTKPTSYLTSNQMYNRLFLDLSLLDIECMELIKQVGNDFETT